LIQNYLLVLNIKKLINYPCIFYRGFIFYGVIINFISKGKGEVIISEIKLVIDNEVLERYNTYYFKQYPKRKKKPIDSPTHPSINKWMVMLRPQMNQTKQNWKDFMIWFVDVNGYKDKKINKCNMKFITYIKTKIRADTDNTVPKFILDGMVEGGFVQDDNYWHIEELTLRCGYSKDHPRTEIIVDIINEHGVGIFDTQEEYQIFKSKCEQCKKYTNKNDELCDIHKKCVAGCPYQEEIQDLQCSKFKV